MLISTTELVCFRFIKGNMNSDIIVSFLNTAFLKLQQNIPRNQNVYLILDNSPLHKTLKMKKICGLFKFNFVFIPPHCPFFNMIEFCFRFIKSDLKTRTSLR